MVASERWRLRSLPSEGCHQIRWRVPPYRRFGEVVADSRRAGRLRGNHVLRGRRREEFQRDVVRIAEGQSRTVGSIDDTAIDDTEFV